MATTVIPNESGQGQYIVLHGNAERLNPLDYLWERHLSRHLVVGRESLRVAGLLTPATEQLVQETLLQNARDYWPEALADQTAEPVPQYLLDLLSAPDKKTQVRLLRGVSVTPKQLLAFVCKAWELGYTFSRYSAHHNPRGTDASKLPRLFGRRDDGSLEKIGQTPLSDAQLNVILDERKVIVATILDKGDEWHCFFNTYRALEGRESYKGGQPHMHYLSSKWGNVTRQQVVEGINEGNYVATNVHIDLLDLSLVDDESQAEPDSAGAPEDNSPASTEPA